MMRALTVRGGVCRARQSTPLPNALLAVVLVVVVRRWRHIR